MYRIELGRIRKEWRGWDGYDSFFEAYEWGEVENEVDYNEEVKKLKKMGYEVYYQDDHQTLFI